jgi:hypothetical protein
MRDDETGPDPKAGSQDRKTRIDGDRVIHTVKGQPYHGDRYTPPMGLTTEQNEEQRTGTKIDERQVREAARGERESTAWSGTARTHSTVERTGGTDEVAEAPYGRKGEKQSREG